MECWLIYSIIVVIIVGHAGNNPYTTFVNSLSTTNSVSILIGNQEPSLLGENLTNKITLVVTGYLKNVIQHFLSHFVSSLSLFNQCREIVLVNLMLRTAPVLSSLGMKADNKFS